MSAILSCLENVYRRFQDLVSGSTAKLMALYSLVFTSYLLKREMDKALRKLSEGIMKEHFLEYPDK